MLTVSQTRGTLLRTVSIVSKTADPYSSTRVDEDGRDGVVLYATLYHIRQVFSQVISGLGCRVVSGEEYLNSLDPTLDSNFTVVVEYQDTQLRLVSAISSSNKTQTKML